jgi:hypothetical protein
MTTFLKDEDDVFVSLATITKIRREGLKNRPSREGTVALREQTPWIAETKEGGQHRFWVHDDEEGVERMLATVIPAAPGVRLYRIYYAGDGENYHSTTTEVYSVICWRVFPDKVEPVIIPRDGEEDWLTYSCDRMNLVEAPPGGRFEFYEVGGFNEVQFSLDKAKEVLIARAKAGLRVRARRAAEAATPGGTGQ